MMDLKFQRLKHWFKTCFYSTLEAYVTHNSTKILKSTTRCKKLKCLIKLHTILVTPVKILWWSSLINLFVSLSKHTWRLLHFLSRELFNYDRLCWIWEIYKRPLVKFYFILIVLKSTNSHHSFFQVVFMIIQTHLNTTKILQQLTVVVRW